MGTAGGYHTVVLKGTAYANQGNSSASELANTIKAQLNALGYGVPAVRVSFNDGVGGYWSSGINLEIEVNARDEDSGEMVRQMISTALAAITWSTVASTYSYLTNIALRVESDNYTAPATTGGGVNTGGGNTQPNTNYGQPNAGVNPNVAPPAGGTNFLDNFATGLGVSTPIIMLGAGVLLLVVLKK